MNAKSTRSSDAPEPENPETDPVQRAREERSEPYNAAYAAVRQHVHDVFTQHQLYPGEGVSILAKVVLAYAETQRDAEYEIAHADTEAEKPKPKNAE